jgi:hypothetical protein
MPGLENSVEKTENASSTQLLPAEFGPYKKVSGLIVISTRSRIDWKFSKDSRYGFILVG